MKKIMLLIVILGIGCGLICSLLAQEEPPQEQPEASTPTPSSLELLCGNEVCEPEETWENCPQDCGVDDVTLDTAIPPSLAP